MADDNPSSAATATRVRYGVLAFLCSLSFILYIDRVCISQAVDPIQKELHLSNTAMSFVLMAFTLAYGLFEVPTGRWGDRFGSRGVLTRIVLWWSAFTALTGAATGLVTLVVVRFLFGAGEAGALPNTFRVIKRWFPAGRRGPSQGVITTSALLGGAVAPVVAAYLIQLVGWRWAFVVFGALGVFWAAAFYLWFRDDPAEHAGVNAAERSIISGDAPPVSVSAEHPRVPWGEVLTSPNVWLLGGVITCAAFASYLYISWFPKYLVAAREVSPIVSGWLSSTVLAGGALGGTLGGIVTDWLVRRTGNVRNSLRCIGSGGLGIAAVALWAGVQCDSAVAASLFTALACMTANMQLATWWAAVTQISGKHPGALFGLMNSMGVPGAAASQWFFGSFTDWQERLGYTGRAQWDPAFYVCVIVLLVGAAGWLVIDASKSVVERAEEKG